VKHLRVAVLGAALLAVGPASVSAKERVVFCRRPEGACALVSRKLGAGPGGFWAVADDKILRAGVGTIPPVLYFAPDQYEGAVGGLSSQERDQAVLHRLALVSENRASFALRAVEDALLQGAMALPDGDAHALRALVEADAMFEAQTLRGTEPNEGLDLIRDSLAALTVEEMDAAAAAGYLEEAAIYERLKGQGGPSGNRSAVLPSTSRPFAEPVPVYFIAPVAPATVARLGAEGDVVLAWRGGIVAAFSAREVEKTFAGARTLRVLYPEASAFIRDASELTSAQIDRRLSARLGGVPAGERAESLAGVAFRHAVLCHALTGALVEARVPWLADWNAAIGLDLDNARLVLAHARRAGPITGRAIGKRVLASLPDDFALAAAIARQAGSTRTASLIARAAITATRRRR
jgi:hypothetical protein